MVPAADEPTRPKRAYRRRDMVAESPMPEPVPGYGVITQAPVVVHLGDGADEGDA